MIPIDGSFGEGGGQVLRSSLALSILTNQPVEIRNIRARRSKPGLLPQHLKAVDAAAAVSRARVEGASLSSAYLLFEPGKIRSGRYKFDIGTAGSTSLVLQTIFIPLSMAGSASTILITGGTHVPHAPSYHYLDRQWLRWMREIGFDAQVSLDQAGFYPQGGGRISATIRPAGNLLPIAAKLRGALHSIQGISAVANLDVSIAERQKRQALQRLEKGRLQAKIKTEQLSSPSKGTMLCLLAEFGTEHSTGPVLLNGRRGINEGAIGGGSRCCYFSLGELGKPAERVADEAVDELLAFMETRATVDQYLADQLLLPLVFASGPSEFLTPKVTQHLTTNAAIIQMFTQAAIEIEGETGQPGRVLVKPQTVSI